MAVLLHEKLFKYDIKYMLLKNVIFSNSAGDR